MATNLILANLFDCPRCWGEHLDVIGKKLAHPVVLCGQVYDAWVSCPVTGDPVFIVSKAEEFVSR